MRARGFGVGGTLQRDSQLQMQRQRRPAKAGGYEGKSTATLGWLDFERFFGVGEFVAFAGDPDVHGRE